MALIDIAAGTCRCCGGHPQSEPAETVSRHVTSEGLVVYTRCVCGALQMWLARWGHGQPRVVAEAQPGTGQ